MIYAAIFVGPPLAEYLEFMHTVYPEIPVKNKEDGNRETKRTDV